MPTIKQISQILEEEETLKLITQAYGELASSKLKQIRSDIEQTRVFFVEISRVFHVVKLLAAQKGVQLPQKTKSTASIILTSNYRFYGPLENELIAYYLDGGKQGQSDRFLIGKTAREFFKHRFGLAGDQSFVLSNDLPTPKELSMLSESIRAYQKILVYYPRFQSLLVQKPSVIDITQTPEPNTASVSKLQFDFIFEPEIGKILDFFDTNIIGVLLQQVFLEAELARTSSRLLSMEEAQVKADALIKSQLGDLARAKRSLQNSQILETISALSKWRTGH